MIRFTKVRDVKSPKRGSAYSAGIDFFVPNDFTTKTLMPGEDVLIPSGIIVEIPEHCALIGVDKSGIASSSIAKSECGMKKPEPDELPSSVIVGAKLIDADYHGEIHIHLINIGREKITINPGRKVAQFVLIPVFYDIVQEVEKIELLNPETERRGGFSSTGI